MIDIEIQISISKRSSGWAINYAPPHPPIAAREAGTTAPESKRKLFHF